MKDLRMTVRLHNNQLRARREALGVSSRELSSRAGVPYVSYLKLENLRLHPKGKAGEWRKTVSVLAGFYHVLEEDLFPEIVQAVQNPKIERELDTDDVMALLPDYMRRAMIGPEEEAIAEERVSLLENKIGIVLGSLSPREEAIIKNRYGFEDADPKTRREIAEEQGCSTSRIKELEAMAMRKLRKPYRTKLLKGL